MDRVENSSPEEWGAYIESLPHLLTQPQLARAHAPARAYLHEWANLNLNYWKRESLDVARIERAVERVGRNSMPGIRAPWLDDGGYVVHTTGTGRLTWIIERDGRTTFFVSRPDGDVLEAVVPAPNRGVRYEQFVGNEPIAVKVLGEFGSRHLDALLDALSVVAERWTAFQALAPLYAAALVFDAREDAARTRQLALELDETRRELSAATRDPRIRVFSPANNQEDD